MPLQIFEMSQSKTPLSSKKKKKKKKNLKKYVNLGNMVYNRLKIN